MNKSTDNIKDSTSGVKFTSLSRGLILWFLLLSLLPLSIVSLVGYQNASISLTKTAVEKLEQSSNLSLRYLKNWFEYRFMDLKTQSKSDANITLLSRLIEGYKGSGESLAEYVKSSGWETLTKDGDADLVTFSRDYDYVYDVFLIDKNGNIFYSVLGEMDLGTNLFKGFFSDTLFSEGMKKSITTGQMTFSDLERYAPSNNMITGFLSSPMFDEAGNILGVISIQVRIDRVLNILESDVKKDSSLVHYLVGEDGRLRTIFRGDRDEILNKEIETKQFRLWKNEHFTNHIKSGWHELGSHEEVV
ncbi:MAG: cache domain-containing protein, partial [Gammaproteobacteria bacterium]|nr:cache domain-containing protein [Gammaproteobacteria bacterium]